MSMREFLHLETETTVPSVWNYMCETTPESWETHFERGWYRSIGWGLGLNEKANLYQRDLFISLCFLTEDTWDQLLHAPIVMTLSCDGCPGKLWAQTKHSGVRLVTVGSGKAFSVLSKRRKGKTEKGLRLRRADSTDVYWKPGWEKGTWQNPEWHLS